MIIAITPDGKIELQEPNDFKGFKISVLKPGMSDHDISNALVGLGTMDASKDHAWISQDALKNMHGRQHGDAWLESFDKMVEKVKPFGWVDEATGDVRAHIERI
jgi:hypothetical protein